MKRISYKKTLRTTLGLVLLFLSTALVLNSCYPGEELTAEDTDIVATFYDKEADFSTKLTYAIKDSVIRLDEDGNPIYNETGPYDQQAINRIKDNMEDAGFTEVADPADADVILFTFTNKTTWVSGGCYSSWYSWYYPYYGYCYPVYYTYEAGTLGIVMIDTDATEQKNALWVAAINGILEDTSAGILDRIYKNIDQAFIQSPYLNK
jgi:hypothetical protein